jgi:nicotinamidase-related amidase
VHGNEYVNTKNIEERTGEWLRAAGGPRLDLSPDDCALLVVDVQRFFAHPRGRSYLPAAAAVIPRLLRLLRGWRRAGHPVAFTRHCHLPDDPPGMLQRFWGSVLSCDDPDSHLIPQLRPAPAEPVLRKTTYDGFRGTGLEDWLRSAGRRQLLVVGLLTHLCVETTVRSAFVRGFEPLVAADATATVSGEMHAGSLRAMAHGFAGVVSVDDVLRTVCGHDG